MRRFRRSTESGFTPVEFLVSLAVIGVVAAVGALGLLQVTAAGRDQSRRVDRRMIETAEEASAARQTGTGVYATETELVRAGLLERASLKSLLCLLPAPPGAPDGRGDYLVLSADPLPATRAAADGACTIALRQRHLPGPATGSTGTRALP